jgi:hypothetical protein
MSLPQPIHVALVSLVCGLVYFLIQLAQRLGEWRSKAVANILGVIAGLLGICVLYMISLWVFKVDLASFGNVPRWIWWSTGVVLVGLTATQTIFRNARLRANKETAPLLVPVISSYEATDTGNCVTLRVRLFVSNSSSTEHTEICGFGLALQNQLPTDHKWSIFLVGPSELYKKTVLLNHPVDGYVDFKVDKAKASDVKGRAFVVTVLSGQIIDGVQKPYTTPPKTIHDVVLTPFAALVDALTPTGALPIDPIIQTDGPFVTIDYEYENSKKSSWLMPQGNTNPNVPLVLENSDPNETAYNVRLLPLTVGDKTVKFEPNDFPSIAGRGKKETRPTYKSGPLSPVCSLGTFLKNACSGLGWAEEQLMTDQPFCITVEYQDGKTPPTLWESRCTLVFRWYRSKIRMGKVERRLRS